MPGYRSSCGAGGGPIFQIVAKKRPGRAAPGGGAPRGTRYLTFSCARRLELLCTPAIRDAFADQLEAVHARGAFRLFAWVVMPDHVHLLLVPGGRWTAPKVVQAIKQPFAQKIIQQWRDSGDRMLGELEDGSGEFHFWEHGRDEERRVATLAELDQAVLAIHENPVRRGYASQARHWRWSSACWYEGRRDSPVTIDTVERLAA